MDEQQQVIRAGRVSPKPGLGPVSGWLSWLAVLLCGILPVALCLAADDPTDTNIEYQVKAAFLLNFTKFIEWPAGTLGNGDEPLSICILGEDPFGTLLDRIAGGEVVKGRKIVIERLKRPPVPKSCRVLFIGAHEKEPRGPLDLRPGVLTVGEGEGFIRNGGMIAFVIENRRVRFVINRAVAESAGFQLSSKLLSVAKPFEK